MFAKTHSPTTHNFGLLPPLMVVFAIVIMAFPARTAAANGGDLKLIAVNSQLSGLGANAVFPFLDSTPNRIVTAHIALTDATTNCSPGGSPPANLQILAGNAGAVPPKLVPVVLENLGIGSTSQCVFHMTVTAGEHGIPEDLTDLVVVNHGAVSLTGINTATASATVRIDDKNHMEHVQEP